MKKPTYKSILSQHIKEQSRITESERQAQSESLPEDFQNFLSELTQAAKDERRAEEQLETSSNVIQVNFGGPRFYIPKTMAGSKSSNIIENWYSKSHLYFDGLSIQLDIDGDYIEVTIKIDEPESASSEFEDYLTAKVGSSFKFALFDGEVQLAEFTGNVVGKSISGAGSIIQHEKVASGEDGLNLRFEE